MKDENMTEQGLSIQDLQERLADLQFLYDNSSFRMGPAYRAEIAKVEEQLAKLTTVAPTTTQ